MKVSQDRIIIFDTTLRDGEQSPGASMDVHEKVLVAKQLEILGVDKIEAGFPITSPGDFDAVQAIAGEVERSSIVGLCRARDEDIQAAWDAVREAKMPCIHTFIATSDVHMTHKLRMSRERVLEEVHRAVSHARELVDDVELTPFQAAVLAGAVGRAGCRHAYPAPLDRPDARWRRVIRRSRRQARPDRRSVQEGGIPRDRDDQHCCAVSPPDRLRLHEIYTNIGGTDRRDFEEP